VSQNPIEESHILVSMFAGLKSDSFNGVRNHKILIY